MKTSKQMNYEFTYIEPKFKIVSWVTMVLSLIITGGLGFWLFCPSVNVRSSGFWVFTISVMVIALILTVVITYVVQKPRFESEFYTKPLGVLGIGVIGAGAIFVILLIVSAPIFNAKTYRNRISVETQSEDAFVNDIPSTKDINKIALMDTESARKLGDRVLGSLSDMVSQFEMGEYYTMEIQGNVMKIAPLEFGSFFKWNSNKDTGIPGYVLVNPITSEAEFIEVKGGINYAPSAFFGKDLMRHIRNAFPTKILGNYTFQVDNEGNVYWVYASMKPNTAVGCENIEGAIVCNAVTGKCDYYKVNEIPEWVDMVYSGELIEDLYNDYGKYVNGFFNFSKKGITATTDDYGYLCVGSDIFVYTGVTSVAADESNLGFILVNSRTGEYKYYQVAGAEEYSAMSAAAGAVQNYGYKASFPSLVNIGGVPTYVMVLKDSNNLVKMYGMVNVKNYTIVAVEDTLNECLNSYNKAVVNAGTSADIDISLDTKSDTITITDIKFLTMDGNTIVYVKGDNEKVYKQNFAQNESLILFNIGDEVTIKYATEAEIIQIVEIEKK